MSKWIFSNLVSDKGELGTAKVIGSSGVDPELIDAIYEIQNLLLEKNEVDLSTAQTYNAYITKNGKWSETLSKSPASYFIALDPKDTVVSVTAQDGLNAYIAFLTSSAHTGTTTPSYAEGTARITIPAGETLEFAKPDDATYLNVAKQYDGVTQTPVKVEITHTKVLGVVEETVTGSTPTITPVDNTVYKCGELSSLAISNPPATGAYSIVFTSGSTATTTTIPATILGLESFAAEANTRYEINVVDGYALVASWPVS